MIQHTRFFIWLIDWRKKCHRLVAAAATAVDDARIAFVSKRNDRALLAYPADEELVRTMNPRWTAGLLGCVVRETRETEGMGVIRRI